MSKKQKSPARASIEKIAEERDRAVLVRDQARINASDNPDSLAPFDRFDSMLNDGESFEIKGKYVLPEAISMPDSDPDKPDKPYPDEIIDTDEKGRRFTPRPCVLCERLREKGVSKSYVYCVKNHNGTKTRHCKCGSCGNTWKQIDSFC